MLELLFQGLIEWLYSLILETWEYFFSVFASVLNVDFDYLKLHIPIIPDIMNVMLAAGWALLLGNLVFQAMKSMMTGLGFEGEDPKLLFSRSFVFSFLLLASPQICRLGLDMAARVTERLGAIDTVNVNLIDADTFVGMGAAWLLTIIINLILMFKLIRFLLKIVEQYLVIAFLTICAPLAFGVGGSKNTSDIFTGWCRMFASMCFLMVSNMTCFKMLLSLLSNVPVGADIFLWIALVFGVVKLAQKADDIITRIGLNPAITGDSRGRSLPGLLAYTVIRSMASQVVKTAGPASGGNGNAGQSNVKTTTNSTQNGRKSNYNSHTMGTGASMQKQSGTQKKDGGKASASRSAAGGTAGGASQGGQSRTTGRPITIIPDDSEEAAMNGPAPTPSGTPDTGAQAQGGTSNTKGAERKTSVPPGTMRSPSVVRQNGVAKKTEKPNGNVAASSTSKSSVSSSRNERHISAATKVAHTTVGKAPSAGTASGAIGNAPKSVAAGTAPGTPVHEGRGDRADIPSGTAGTSSEAQARFTNASHTVRNDSVQATTRAESRQSDSTKSGQHKTPSNSVKHIPDPVGSGAKGDRFSQRPAAPNGIPQSGVEQKNGALSPTAAQRSEKMPASSTAGTSSVISIHAGRGNVADVPSTTSGTPSGTQERFSGAALATQSGTTQAKVQRAEGTSGGGKTVKPMKGGVKSSIQSNPGVKETSSSRLSAVAFVPTQSGTAGTGRSIFSLEGSNKGIDSHVGTSGTTPGTAGTPAEVQTRLTNAPRTTQNYTARNTAQISNQGFSVTESGEKAAISGTSTCGVAAPQSSPNTKETRYTQRARGDAAPVSPGDAGNIRSAEVGQKGESTSFSTRMTHQALDGNAARGTLVRQEPHVSRQGTVSSDGAHKASTPTQQESHTLRPSAASPDNTHKGSAPAQQESRAPRPVAASPDSTRKTSTPAHQSRAPRSAAASPDSTHKATARAQQESRAPHPAATNPDSTPTGSAPAQQESRAPRPVAASPDSTHKPYTPAQQEFHTPRSTNVGSETTRPVSASNPARQDKRLSVRNTETVKDGKPGLRPGTAGIAPPAARSSRAEKPERPPHQETAVEEPKPMTEGTVEYTNVMKEVDASERAE